MPFRFSLPSANSRDCRCFVGGGDISGGNGTAEDSPPIFCRTTSDKTDGGEIKCLLGVRTPCYPETKMSSLPKGYAVVPKDWVQPLKDPTSKAILSRLKQGLQNHPHLDADQYMMRAMESDIFGHQLRNHYPQFTLPKSTCQKIKSLWPSKKNETDAHFTVKLNPTLTMTARASELAQTAAKKSSLPELEQKQLADEVLLPVVEEYLSLFDDDTIAKSKLSYPDLKTAFNKACSSLVDNLSAAIENTPNTVNAQRYMLFAKMPSEVPRSYSWNPKMEERLHESVPTADLINRKFPLTREARLDATHLLMVTTKVGTDSEVDVLTCTPTFMQPEE